jgi:predicted Zn-dependent protease
MEIKGMRILVSLICFGAASFSFSGCSTVPATGKSALLLMPESALIEQSNSLFAEMRKNERVSRNAQHNAMAQRVGEKIAKVAEADMPNVNWQFVVFEGDQLNAFALPGGQVGIYTGIFNLVDEDSDLATVVSHEIAHVTAQHGNQRMSRQMLVVAGGVILAAATQKQEDKTKNAMLAAYGLGSQVGVVLPFSRSQELEADQLGLHYMTRAGYNPRRAIVFWEKMMQKKNANMMPELLSTHPAHRTRIAALQKQVEIAIDEHNSSQPIPFVDPKTKTK